MESLRRRLDHGPGVRGRHWRHRCAEAGEDVVGPDQGLAAGHQVLRAGYNESQRRPAGCEAWEEERG